MIGLLKELLRTESGQDVIEYAYLTAGIGLCGLLAWPAIAQAIGDVYRRLDTNTQDLWEIPPPWSRDMTTAEIAAVVIALVASGIDLRTARIPNLLTFPTAFLGVLYHGTALDGLGVASAATGLALGLAIYFPVFALGAMGAGDVKLMAALGAWLGPMPTVYVALYGAVAGGVLALMLSIWKGYTRTAFTNVRALLLHWWVSGPKPLPALTLEAGRGLRLAYALPILVGVMVTIWSY